MNSDIKFSILINFNYEYRIIWIFCIYDYKLLNYYLCSIRYINLNLN